MEKWPIGVFTSIDAGLGVKIEVAHELGVPTIQLHAPAAETRTPENAESFLAQLEELGITLTAVFGGFDGNFTNITADTQTMSKSQLMKISGLSNTLLIETRVLLFQQDRI